MARMQRSERGFSVLEMMVVVLILGILAAIAVPNFLGAFRRYQLESSARNVSNILLRARYEAIRSNQNVTTISSAGNPSVYGVDLDGSGTLDPNEPRMGLSSRVQMTAAGAPPLATMGANYTAAQVPPGFGVTFSPRGTSMQLVGAFFIEAANVYILFVQHQVDGSWAAVTITPGGRLRVWFYSGNAWSS